MPPDIERVRLALFLGALGVLYAVESLRPERPWTISHSRRLAVHAALSLFNSLLLRLSVAGPLAAWVIFVRSQGWGLAGLLGLSGPVEILAAVAVFDGLDYWWHRFNHSVPFLWRFHRAHHLDTHVDVTTALRFHPGELFLSAVFKALWALAWGPSLWAFALCEASVTAFAQIHHSNVDLPDSWERVVRRVWITPRIHASHHTVSRRSRDANYSTIFSVWDRLFGSFAEPERGEMRRLGLESGRENDLSPWAILSAPLRP